MKDKKKETFLNINEQIDFADNSEEVNIEHNERDQKENLELLDSKSEDFQINLALLGDTQELEKKEETVKNKKKDSHINQKDMEILKEAKKNNKKKKKSFDWSFILVVIAIIGCIGFFFNGDVFKIGFGISLFSLFISMLCLNKRALFGTTAFALSFLFSIIYLIVLIISYTKVDDKIDVLKSNEFRENAIKFIDEVKDEVTDKKIVKCNSRNTVTQKVNIPSLSIGVNSPFENEYNKDASFVLVESKEVNGMCEYRYFIYLTDDKYSLGSVVTPIIEEKVKKTAIRRVS